MDTLISTWKPPADEVAPMAALAKAVKSYEPGQGFIGELPCETNPKIKPLEKGQASLKS